MRPVHVAETNFGPVIPNGQPQRLRESAALGPFALSGRPEDKLPRGRLPQVCTHSLTPPYSHPLISCVSVAGPAFVLIVDTLQRTW